MQSTTNVIKWMNKEKIAPTVAEIHLTDRCNLNCSTCWQYNRKKGMQAEIADADWLRLAEQLANIGIKECYLGGGGEPMQRSRLALSIIKKMKDKNIFVEMTTNLTLFSEEDVKEMILRGVDHLQVSIDGPDRETQDVLRGNGVFDKNLNTLLLFKNLKNELGKTTPHISIHTVVSNKNFDKVSKLVDFAHETGVDAVNLQELVIMTQNCKNFSLNEKENNAFQIELKQAFALAKEKNITNNFGKFILAEPRDNIKKTEIKSSESANQIKCSEPWEHLTILSNWDVKTCCNPSNITESLHQKNIDEIWLGEKFNRLRSDFCKGKLMSECCTHPSKRM